MERLDVPSLLTSLSLEEKAALASGSGFWHTRAIERLGVPSIMVSDGPHGLRKQDRSADHVGLGESVPATCFPPAVALASSWDTDLARRVGRAIGVEARAQGIGVVLGPGVNIKRSPLCGRNFEYLAEDPALAGILGAAFVDGVQAEGIGTSLKHYAANNQETDRVRVSAEVDERTLREIYLAPFERIVRDAQPWTVMCSYNRINGVYASQDPWLLTEVLRHEWGFEGMVVSDWGAVDDPVAAVAAGLDLEMPSSRGAGPRRMVAAVRDGALDESVLDTAAGRVLRLVDRVLTGDPAAGDQDAAPADGPTFDQDAHHDLARTAAADCVVLLENDGLLPLDTAGRRIAVIGEFARTPRYQGAGSSKVNPTRLDDALTALRAGAGDGATVDFAAGFGVDDPSADAAALLAEAVEVATGADAVVVFLGLPAGYESEGFDRDHLDLPAEQLAVLDAVASANDRIVVVLANGGVVAVEAWRHRARAVVEGWLGGQGGGAAVADVLLGRVNPSGRLAETVPLRLADTPAHLNFPGEDGRVRYGEGVFVGYRHFDALDREVSYPFGHGLSYTTFDHTDLEVTVLGPSDAPTVGQALVGWRGSPRIAAALTVTNTGPVAGKEVVQLYVGRPHTGPQPEPVRELRAFTKVALAPCESRRIELVLDERDLSRWSTRTGGWVLEPGAHRIEVGASSRDIRLTAEVDLDAATSRAPLDHASTLGEWLDHPTGRDLLLERLREAPGGDLTSLVDDDRVKVIASFPLARLSTMLGGVVDADAIAEMLGRVARREPGAAGAT